MKMTVVLDKTGEIVAVQQGPIQDPAGRRESVGSGGLVAGPGQKLEERDVPDHLGSIEGIEKLPIEDVKKRAEEIRVHLTS